MSQINQSIISEEEIIRPTHVEVDLRVLRENFASIKKRVSPSKLMIVLKANAYGHGLVEIAKLLETLDVDYLSVAFLEEGILLRKNGIIKPILVLGGLWGNQVPLFLKYDLTITASSIEKLNQINDVSESMNKKALVHLKIDTGMERIGVHYYSAENFLEHSLKLNNIKIEGIYSHFANADSTDLTHTELQLERFNEVLTFYQKRSLPAPIRHISNSGAILQLPEANLDMVRPGLLFYGIYPTTELPKTVVVNPALTWKSLVVFFKVIKPKHPVGYGLRWETDKNTRAVTIPVGYGDGYMRGMSGNAEVIIRGERFPVIGTISMDQIIANIKDKTAYNGDEVILLGKSGETIIRAEELAKWAGTIPYEILTNINTRVPRIYIR
ncbi:MAG: alanine racemase [Melioribacteraceae bacterium]|nr:alanine racemase [Melioribacteraceae bacterium]MCF8263545.1 alanine racemase [Melioribacteraceae bacterium]MCF8430671.1 alanine racemase [Melioribacteraceae bacterium]